MSRTKIQALVAFAVLVIGVGATAALINARKTPERVERPVRGPLVEVVTVTTESVRADVAGQGEVQARRRVQLAPQVTGRVVAVDPSLVAGGRFSAGEALLRVEARDFELAVERARAAVARAQTTIEREQAEADVAIAEWRETEGEQEAPPLLARRPQIAQAQAELAAARADLATAELNLSRTRLSLPFDGLVLDEQVDVGQLVTAGQPIATVFGTDAVEVRVPLADDALEWIEMPRGDGGPPVTVSTEFAGRRHAWTGTATRLEGQIDPRSRMVHVVVEIPDPFEPADSGEQRPPLLPGAFVEVAIAGEMLDDVTVVPRAALRQGDVVWVVENDTLRIRPVDVLRTDRDHALLGAGLASGERLVVSALDAVTDGMAVRVGDDAGAVTIETQAEGASS